MNVILNPTSPLAQKCWKYAVGDRHESKEILQFLYQHVTLLNKWKTTGDITSLQGLCIRVSYSQHSKFFQPPSSGCFFGAWFLVIKMSLTFWILKIMRNAVILSWRYIVAEDRDTLKSAVQSV